MFVLVAFLLGAGAFVGPVYATSFGPLLFRVVWAVLYLVIVIALFQKFGAEWVNWLIRAMPMMCLVIGVAFLSAVWSFDPSMTSQRAIHLGGTSLVGVFLGYTFRQSKVMLIIFWIFALLIVLNLIAAVVMPDAVTTYVYREGLATTGWEGVLGNKNNLGSVAVIALMLSLVGVSQGQLPKGVGVFMLLLSFVTLFLSQSATALVVAATGCGCIAILTIAKLYRVPVYLTLLLIGVGLAVMAVLTFVYVDTFTSLLGRDTTLTNRTSIWHDALVIVRERPWTGYGYGVVWGLGEQTWLPDLPTTSWAMHAHNGYLDLANQVGVAVTIVAMAHIVLLVYQSTKALGRQWSPFGVFCVAYLFTFIVMNLTEATLYASAKPEWMLFVAVAVALQRLSERQHESESRQRIRRRHGRRHSRVGARGSVTELPESGSVRGNRR